jgi:hypothetical protein
MIHQLHKKIWKAGETYSLIRKLSCIDGSNLDAPVLDRVMYNAETLPTLGKEYWWFHFISRDGESPMQFMLLIFRKHGRRVKFNDKEMALRELRKDKFQAVTAGWIYDGDKLSDLGDTNAVTEVDSERKTIVSTISGRKMVLNGSFPSYRLDVDEIIYVDIGELYGIADKSAHGIFIPPFGVGWVDVFLEAQGSVLGKRFRGTAHLQKVVGVTTFGPFHWGRIVFQRGFSISFFCLKAGRDSKRYFRRYIDFRNCKNNMTIEFENPKMQIQNKDDGNQWIVEAYDDDKKVRIVLASYAKKRYTIKGGGSQVYIEYAVIAEEFDLEAESEVISLDDLGKGVGTFEDAYGSPI